MKMNRILPVAALLLAAALPARAEEEVDAAARETLTATLTAQGYEVRKMEVEDGLIEVYVDKDGKMEELWFDAGLKQVEHEEGDEG